MSEVTSARANTSRATERVVAFDGIRGLAILAVMGAHAQIRGTQGGSLGVDMFFVLSGFLITGILVAERDHRATVSLRNFYVRRVLRLYPALLLVVLLSLLVLPQLGTPGEPAPRLTDWGHSALVALTYTTNIVGYLGSSWGGLFGHTWSLALEEQFYLLWPPVLVFGLYRGWSRNRLAAIALAGFALSTLALIVQFHPSAEFQGPHVYGAPQARAGALLLGCAIALMPYHRLSKRTATRLAGVGLILLAGVLLTAPENTGGPHQRWYYYASLPACWVVTAVLIGGLAAAPGAGLAARALSLGPLRGIGTISYGTYLVHIPVLHVLLHHSAGLERRYLALLMIVVSLAAATISYVLVERRFLRLKERLAPRPVAVL